ncbi:homeobox KN domain-containing protein [Lasiosphaeria miniovina]|uniref:Homeobox KN domain-containing protein n=1 Tax=Lasiosphaeria miniovina TaxID=1954250 RepID=A0AA40DVY0_9PEZI|nr:homeobox KN domain-containing protein [Lasiosphaeria miniovina]KAK0718354.1 homeobox KN domain-containing protein [Lasiosphaeria miniovina]
MSMNDNAQNTPNSASQREARQPEYDSSRCQNDIEEFKLPSIRQAFPQIQFDLNARAPEGTTSPYYTHTPSPKKRGRTSVDQIPRPYASPEIDGQMLFSSNSPFCGSYHPSRSQSLSLRPTQSFDRTPFSPATYVSQYQDYMRGGGEMGPVGSNGSGPNKQRKRRGNLPKEATDKLRAWVLAHLHHPYPSEEEKRELARQTRLRMNQISNWLINARRRDPAIRRNARAGSDDTTRKSAPLSDGEGSAYDDDLDGLKRLRTASINRGSI